MTDHEESQLKAAYQEHLFGSESALLFAEHLLTKLLHFKEIDSDLNSTHVSLAVQVQFQNVAKGILTMCDRWEGIGVQAYLQNLPIAVKEKEDE